MPWGASPRPNQPGKDASLDNILPQQVHRVELLLLIVLCTDMMRNSLDQAFTIRHQQQKSVPKPSDNDLLSLNDGEETMDGKETKRDTSYNNLDPLAASQELESLKATSTTYFNAWRTSVLRRLGEKLKVSPASVKRAKENYMTGLEAERRARKHFDDFDLMENDERDDSSSMQSPVILTPSSSVSNLTVAASDVLTPASTPRTTLSRQTSCQSQSQSQAQAQAQAQPKTARSASTLASSPSLSFKINTKLGNLPSQTRGLILNAVLFILLSLEHYPSHSRILLAKLAYNLDLPSDVLISAEANLALTLQQSTATLHEPSSSAASTSSSSAPHYQRTPSNSSSSSGNTRWKIGLATVAGAALVGVTGGLAAPFLLGAAGAIMGGVGLGGLASLLGATIANPVTVAALFGVLGGRMGGKAMAEFEKEIEDFEIVGVRDRAWWEEVEDDEHGKKEKNDEILWDGDEERDDDRFFRSSLDEKAPRIGAETDTRIRTQSQMNASTTTNLSETKSTAPSPSSSPHLRLILGISGWVLHSKDIVKPWRVFLPSHFTPHALRYEQSSLLQLSESMDKVLQQSAYSLAQAGALQLALPAVSAALLPVSLLSMGTSWLDNPFSIAMERSDKAGKVLARALAGRVLQGERPVSLIGFSLGARVIYSCLMEMVRISTSLGGGNAKGKRGGEGLMMNGSGGFGIVEHVVLIGAPVPSDELVWRKIRAIAVGRVVNVYTTSDLLLGYLYRVRYAQMAVAGLEPIRRDVKNVESYDVTHMVKGHAQYRLAVGNILRDVVGFEGLDMDLVEEEEKELQNEDRREKSIHDVAKREGKLDGQEDEDGSIVMMDKSADAESDIEIQIDAASASATTATMARNAKTTATIENNTGSGCTTGGHRASVKGKIQGYASNKSGSIVHDGETVRHAT